MDLFEVTEKRRSIRSFRQTEVEVEKLGRILQAANQAPSAGNLQAYEIYVVRDLQKKKEVARASYFQDFIAGAPVVLIFCAHPERSARKYRERGRGLYAVQDATIACTFAMLAASAQGLGTVWVGAFNEETIWQLIGSPQGVRPVAILPVGYPDEDPPPNSRRSLDDLVHEV